MEGLTEVPYSCLSRPAYLTQPRQQPAVSLPSLKGRMTTCSPCPYVPFGFKQLLCNGKESRLHLHMRSWWPASKWHSAHLQKLRSDAGCSGPAVRSQECNRTSLWSAQVQRAMWQNGSKIRWTEEPGRASLSPLHTREVRQGCRSKLVLEQELCRSFITLTFPGVTQQAPASAENLSFVQLSTAELRQSSFHYSTCPWVIIILLKHFPSLGYIYVWF